jgi:hypothetical protein
MSISWHCRTVFCAATDGYLVCQHCLTSRWNSPALMTTSISMLSIDLAKGSFQVCAIGDGFVRLGAAANTAGDDSGRAANLSKGDGGLRDAVAPGSGDARAQQRGAACAGGRRESVREAPEERLRGCLGNRGCGFAADHGLRGSQERGDPVRAVAFRTHGCLVR